MPNFSPDLIRYAAREPSVSSLTAALMHLVARGVLVTPRHGRQWTCHLDALSRVCQGLSPSDALMVETFALRVVNCNPPPTAHRSRGPPRN